MALEDDVGAEVRRRMADVAADGAQGATAEETLRMVLGALQGVRASVDAAVLVIQSAIRRDGVLIERGPDGAPVCRHLRAKDVTTMGQRRTMLCPDCPGEDGDGTVHPA